MERHRLEPLAYYSQRLQRLRVDRAHGQAPHKPILLLAVMEQIERHLITHNHIDLSPQLTDTFLKYWSYLGSANHRPDISRPYFHMKSGKFWHLVPRPGFETVLAAKVKLKTLGRCGRPLPTPTWMRTCLTSGRSPNIGKACGRCWWPAGFRGNWRRLRKSHKPMPFKTHQATL